MPLPSQSDQPSKQFQEKMADLELKRKEARARQSALVLGMPYANLATSAISAEILGMIPEETARTMKVIAFERQGQTLMVGTVQAPMDQHHELARQLKKERYVNVKWYFVSEQSLQHALALYTTVPKFTPTQEGVTITTSELARWESFTTLADISTKLQGLSITDMLNLIIAGALNTRSSDIHIEAMEKEVKLRYRIDGVLTDITTLSKNIWERLVARLKLLSKLKLNVTDHPQDGRFRIALPETKDEKVDVRVSTLPTQFGESIVIRLLGSSLLGEISFDSLGLSGNALEKLRAQVNRPNGMVITTGPTGSGKTTTMYTILKMLNKPGVKIITIEDPIEYELKGIVQSQVDPGQEYTFANGLKSIVRQDPDIILVGEIRDKETTEIAIQAALTGHLVLSTVHTNSASGTIPRLVALGAKPFLLAPAVNAMIGQRLVRKLCEYCKRSSQLAPELLSRVRSLLESIPSSSGVSVDLEKLSFFASQGCPRCNDIGYSGQIAIFEIMVMNKEMEKLIHDGSASEIELQDMAVKNGMVTMAQDGLLKAIKGLTSVDEVFRVAE